MPTKKHYTIATSTRTQQDKHLLRRIILLHVLLRAQTYSTTSSDATRGDRCPGRSWQTLFCFPRKRLVAHGCRHQRSINVGILTPVWFAFSLGERKVRLEIGGVASARSVGFILTTKRAGKALRIVHTPQDGSLIRVGAVGAVVTIQCKLCCASRIAPP